MPRNSSEDEILKDGDIVNVDVSIYNGYFSDSSRMFYWKCKSPRKKKLVHVTKECVEIGISKGKTMGTIEIWVTFCWRMHCT